jgi:RNA-binding protein YhbY
MNIQDENSVTLQLGKKGLSETFYLEVLKNLRQNRLVKIKILKNAMENSDKDTYSQKIIENVSQKANIEHKLIGKTLFLQKKKNIQEKQSEANFENLDI